MKRLLVVLSASVLAVASCKSSKKSNSSSENKDKATANQADDRKSASGSGSADEAKKESSTEAEGTGDDNSSSKEEDIRKLVRLNGGIRPANVRIDRIIKKYKKQKKNVPDKVWKEIRKKLEDEKQDFVDELVPIYDEHFTHEEIRRMVIFYESKAGQKFVKLLPQILSKTSKKIQKWSGGVVAEVTQYLRSKGYAGKDK